MYKLEELDKDISDQAVSSYKGLPRRPVVCEVSAKGEACLAQSPVPARPRHTLKRELCEVGASAYSSLCSYHLAGTKYSVNTERAKRSEVGW